MVNDPFESLRSLSDAGEPDLTAIRGRARRIRVRRYAVLATAAISALALAAVAVVLRTPPGGGHRPGGSRTLTQPLEGGPGSAQDAVTDGGAAATAGESGAAVGASPPTRVAPSGAPLPGKASGETPAAVSTDDSVLEIQLESSRDTAGPGEEFAFVLIACNRSSRVTRIAFPSAQRFDIEVSRRDQVIWVWSAGRSFAQQAGAEQWQPNECRSFPGSDEPAPRWSGRDSGGKPVPPGTYFAVGSLKTPSAKLTNPRRLCIAACAD